MSLYEKLFCILLIVCCFIMGKQYVELRQCKAAVKSQNLQVMAWKRAGDDLQERINLAEKKIVDYKKHEDVKLSLLRNIKHASCEDSAKWARDVKNSVLDKW